MRLTPTARAIGLRLARDVESADPSQMPILRADAVMTERYARALRELGIQAVWVHDEFSKGIEPVDLVAPKLRREAAPSVARALEIVKDAFQSGGTMPATAADSLHEVVEKIAASVASNVGSV